MHHLYLPQPLPYQSKLVELPKPYLISSHHPTTSKPTLSPKLSLHKTNKLHQNPTQNGHTRHWNAKIKHCIQKGNYKDSISLYNQMLDQQITPNSSTFAHLLKACSLLTDLKSLKLLHNDILRFQLHSDDYVCSLLVYAYLQCGCTGLAHQLFEKMSQRDVISWTMFIRQYHQDGQFNHAIQTFRGMIAEGVLPDEVALVSMTSVTTGSRYLKHGLEVHGYLMRKGFELNEIVIGSLLNMYIKLGKVEFSDRITDGITEKNVVVWTMVIMGLINSGNALAAVMAFVKMVNSGVQPNEKTLSSVLRAVSQLGFLRIGIQIHAYIIKRRFATDRFVMSSLMDVYAKYTTDIHSCRKLFDQIQFKDVVSWTAMIWAYGRMGQGLAALRAFDAMRKYGPHPDSVAFTAILSACSSSGMLDDGLRCFNSMIRDYKIGPREEHCSCLRDLIAKDGRLDEACEIIEEMDLRGEGAVWEAFLSACRVHGNVGLGELAARKLVEIEPQNYSGYRVLADIYSAAGKWEDAEILWKLVNEKLSPGPVENML